MASWLQNRLKAAEELLESVDRQAKSAAVPCWDSPKQNRDGAELPGSYLHKSKVPHQFPDHPSFHMLSGCNL